ncbi:MAG: alpha/beta hydrolase [Chitinophagales bacterium]|nr:alpha/beta hydrolase [Chitinophagales bacterium]MDW8419420.1 alpha/beta hydrolase [Chitinophagales bacterium]
MPYVPLFVVKSLLRRFKERADVSNPQRARRGFEKLVSRWNTPLRGFDYLPENADGIPGEWIIPAGAEKSVVLLYFHGGGYFSGSFVTHRALVSHIAKLANVAALNVNYRLAPEHPYPAAIEDCVRVYQWLMREKNYAPQQIVLGGDSAGGGCVINTLVWLRDHNMPLPRCAFALSPWLDMTLSGESYQTKKDIDPMLRAEAMPMVRDFYLQGADPKSPYASPIFHPLHGLPPLYIQVGEEEILLSDSATFANKAKAEGSPVELEIFPKMFHVFNAFWRLLPKAREANKKIARFIRQNLAR